MGWSLVKPNTTGVQAQYSRLKRAAESLWVENLKQQTQKPSAQSVHECRRTWQSRSSLRLQQSSQTWKPTPRFNPSAKLGSTFFGIQSYCSFHFTEIWTSTSFCFFLLLLLLFFPPALMEGGKIRLCEQLPFRRRESSGLQNTQNCSLKITNDSYSAVATRKNRLITCLRSPERLHIYSRR